jgi:hypothetical protein
LAELRKGLRQVWGAVLRQIKLTMKNELPEFTITMVGAFHGPRAQALAAVAQEGFAAEGFVLVERTEE